MAGAESGVLHRELCCETYKSHGGTGVRGLGCGRKVEVGGRVSEEARQKSTTL